MDSLSLGMLMAVLLVVCVVILIIRAVLRIDHSVRQRDRIIELLEGMQKPEKE
ncbi:hypothetical protein G8770_03690 [Aestuariicella hydrocarbonica]|uniref:DUF4083 domain-containing protein n=1 Tax=Pseudomaricurvus hydrocarbonicus TaxID=1470433 RepID=A0A9E5JSC0_9GAMM|nr:hypothetical protein [Aestuariicella hydrocarbonica]NHO64648.1 hypothetical protein [Aestuariicella hydrocarbonica]